MAGVVYLRTNRFEVKLEGITFKKKNFESLCKVDFLFPDGKSSWADQPPIVGLDVMCHPRDPSIILLLLSFGVGCVILRFNAGESLPAPIHRFLADKRIRFVGFGIPEKMELFPFKELGLKRTQMDIGFIAAAVFQDSKYRHYDLAHLARKVLGIKKMMGMTDPSSFERHAQIKCAICQLFLTTLIAMGLSDFNRSNHNTNNSTKTTATSFLKKNLTSLQLMAQGWFKTKRNDHRHHHDDDENNNNNNINNNHNNINNRPPMETLLLVNADDSSTNHQLDPFHDYSGDEDVVSEDTNSPIFKFEQDEEAEADKGNSPSPPKKPIKGILKCPSTTLNRCRSSRSPSLGTPLSPSPCPSPSPSSPSPSPSLSPSPSSPNFNKLKRANSKGCNVRFKFQ